MRYLEWLRSYVRLCAKLSYANKKYEELCYEHIHIVQIGTPAISSLKLYNCDIPLPAIVKAEQMDEFEGLVTAAHKFLDRHYTLSELRNIAPNWTTDKVQELVQATAFIGMFGDCLIHSSAREDGP